MLNVFVFCSTAESPGFVQPPIVIKSRYELHRVVTGLLPNKKYRFIVLATTSKGASVDPNFVEVITSSAESTLSFFHTHSSTTHSNSSHLDRLLFILCRTVQDQLSDTVHVRGRLQSHVVDGRLDQRRQSLLHQIQKEWYVYAQLSSQLFNQQQILNAFFRFR